MVQHAPCPNADPDGYIDYIEQFTMPIGPQVSAAAGLARAWFKPRFVGLENLPDGPALGPDLRDFIFSCNTGIQDLVHFCESGLLPAQLSLRLLWLPQLT